MPRRKKVLTENSPIMYKAKMREMALAICHGDPECAEELASAWVKSWGDGFGRYHSAWETAKNILVSEGVPSALHGLYKAFVNNLIHECYDKKRMTKDEVIARWSRKGLDAGLLGKIADAVLPIVEKEASPAPKT
ncbi:MAG: hypothetical protein DRH17_12880 [Deltaproteobacteria bacterium]|nr:MAG: hypothetical protein DRH17_12880 [Deltaproteobacteria bacterium]